MEAIPEKPTKKRGRPKGSTQAKKEVIRDKGGKFLPGKSGNPKGRPLGAKNRIVKAKQELEVLLREDIVNAEQIRSIWLSMVAEAQNGNVSAAKLILDKVMSNAKVDEDVSEGRDGITIKIENVTLPGREKEVLEGDYTIEE